MPRKNKVVWIPFEGRKTSYNSVSEAAKDLKLSYPALISRSARTNTDLILVNKYGKLEKCD